MSKIEWNGYTATFVNESGTLAVRSDIKPPMFKLPDGMTCYVDVDDTLIQWDVPTGDESESSLVTVETRGHKETFVVNVHNLEYVKKMAVRGHIIIVWSAAGVEWADSVVKALGIEHMVSAVLSKPNYYVDDIRDSNRFMGKYVFFDKDGNRNGHSPKEDK
jgi:predicted HAD superfamily phosphohydrolase YqeG